MPGDPLLGVDDTTASVTDEPPTTGRRWRRVGVTALCLLLLAAALGLLGPRTADTSARRGGYLLEVTYPQVIRAGEPAPLHLRITADSGFGDVVEVSLCDEIFDDLDFQNWYPNPSAETASPGVLDYEFDAPVEGDTLDVSLDARAAPGQFGNVDDCEVAVLDQGVEQAATTFTTWRMP